MSSFAEAARVIRVADPQESVLRLRMGEIAMDSCSCLKGYLRAEGFAGIA